MKTNKEGILNSVSKALDDPESMFWGFTTAVSNDEKADTEVFTDSDDIDADVANSILMASILHNLVSQKGLEYLISIDDLDLNYFTRNMLSGANKVIEDRLHVIGKSVDNDNPVNFMQLGKNSRRGMIAIDVSNPEMLKNNKEFQTMPHELQNAILKQAKKVNHAE